MKSVTEGRGIIFSMSERVLKILQLESSLESVEGNVGSRENGEVLGVLRRELDFHVF